MDGTDLDARIRSVKDYIETAAEVGWRGEFAAGKKEALSVPSTIHGDAEKWTWTVILRTEKWTAILIFA